MSPSTLHSLKQDISKFYKLYSSLVQYWNKDQNTYPQTVVIEALLQNMAFNAIGCEGYSHEKEVKDMYERFDVLSKLNSYYDSYMVKLACNEIDSMFITAQYNED